MVKKRSVGFTIVELLIVIVIIGILASLVIVAYNGIQQRANNTTTMSAVTAHIKALRQYGVDNGVWPPNAVSHWPCVGDQYNTGGCGQLPGTCVAAGVSCNTAMNTQYNTDLRPYYGNSAISTPSLQEVTYNGTFYRGAWSHANTSTGSISIRYFLSGNESCGSPAGITASKSYGDSTGSVCLATIASP